MQPFATVLTWFTYHCFLLLFLFYVTPWPSSMCSGQPLSQQLDSTKEESVYYRDPVEFEQLKRNLRQSRPSPKFKIFWKSDPIIVFPDEDGDDNDVIPQYVPGSKRNSHHRHTTQNERNKERMPPKQEEEEEQKRQRQSASSESIQFRMSNRNGNRKATMDKSNEDNAVSNENENTSGDDGALIAFRVVNQQPRPACGSGQSKDVYMRCAPNVRFGGK